ncbi:MAG: PD-(D/E)XK nuclease family protein [Thermoguttaceae bacterium]|jgi:hypothetical protein
MGKRVFFPRDVANAKSVPFLQSVAQRLIELAADGSNALNMARYACILPGRRAIRTFEAYLIRAVYEGVNAGRFDPDWTPPALLQLGEAPEKLYDQPRRLANSLTSLCCENRALHALLTGKRAENGKNKGLLRDEELTFHATNLFAKGSANPTQRLQELAANTQRSFKLAQAMLALDQELADERKTWRDVANVCEARGLVDERRRWQALGALRELYREELEKCDRLDRNDAREMAIREGLIGNSLFDSVGDERREYFVIGAVDLNRQQKDVFNALGDRVEYWIYAPTASATNLPSTSFERYFSERPEEFFDEFGCVVPQRWDPALDQDRVQFTLPIPDENIFQVDSPEEQGEAVALLTRELSWRHEASDAQDYAPVEPEQLTIGAPDAEVVPFIEDKMKELGYQTIHGEGSPATQNRVYRTLELIADYLETRSYDVLGEILRRPDVERWLCRVWDQVELPNSRSDADSTLQRELDEAAQADADAQAAEELESGGRLGESAVPISGELWLRDYDDYRSTFLPTRVDGHWFFKRDEDADDENSKSWRSHKRAKYYFNLRKATYILDGALKDVLWGQNPENGVPGKHGFIESTKLRNIAPNVTQRSGVDAEHAPVEEMKFDAEDFDIERLSLSGNVEYSTYQVSRPLHEWTDFIAGLAQAIYGKQIVEGAQGSREEEAQISGFFTYLKRALDALDEVPSLRSGAEDVTGSYAIRVVLSEISRRSIPPTPGSEVVEIQGWLDLLFDDAPYCVLTGFNEGIVPSTRSSDLFLPNEMRKALGISDAAQVFARDAYLAYTLAQSRAGFFVVFGKRSLQKDPRTPSRLLFATDEEDVPARVVKYFGSTGVENFEELRRRHKDRPFPRQQDHQPAERDGVDFQAPTIRLHDATPLAISVNKSDGKFVMNVTDFERFLQSPYRYFLRKYVRLNPAPQDLNELDAASFGTIAHDVLRDFGKNETVRDSRDENIIFSWLSKRLDERAALAFNDYSSPFVRVQIEELRARLRSFSAWQAQWRDQGFRIARVEDAAFFKVAELGDLYGGARKKNVDDSEIFGRIDRIDRNDHTGQWYVFDYKTFDSAQTGRSDGGRRDKNEKDNDGEQAANKRVDFIETNTMTLLSSNPNNAVDLRHRGRMNPDAQLPVALGKNFSECSEKRWTNLQLPLYRRLFAKIVDAPPENATLGFIVLTPSDVQAYGAPWTQEELAYADATGYWVVSKIWEFFEKTGRVDPNAVLDEFLPVLDLNDVPYFDDFASITRSYLDEN